jgi:hypothetical protein
LHNKRNIIVHSTYFPEPPDGIKFIVHSTYFPEPPDGIKFVHTIARNGKLNRFPEDAVHTFASLEDLFGKARAASDHLQDIRRKSAVVAGSDKMLNELLKADPILSKSRSNIIPFPET